MLCSPAVPLWNMGPKKSMWHSALPWSSSSVVFCCRVGFWHPFSVSPSLSVFCCLLSATKPSSCKLCLAVLHWWWTDLYIVQLLFARWPAISRSSRSRRFNALSSHWRKNSTIILTRWLASTPRYHAIDCRVSVLSGSSIHLLSFALLTMKMDVSVNPWSAFVELVYVIHSHHRAPCRGSKNRPAPFLGRMYKATKPGLVSVLYLIVVY